VAKCCPFFGCYRVSAGEDGEALKVSGWRRNLFIPKVRGYWLVCPPPIWKCLVDNPLGRVILAARL